MSNTLSLVTRLNTELEIAYQNGDPLIQHVSIRALALVANLDPLSYELYPKRHRPRIVGEFALRAFVLSDYPTDERNDIWNAWPVIGEDHRMYMVSYGNQTNQKILEAARLVGLI